MQRSILMTISSIVSTNKHTEIIQMLYVRTPDALKRLKAVEMIKNLRENPINHK